MPIEAFARKNCSVAKTLSWLGERWSVLIIRELFLGHRRFDEMQNELGIATNVLSSRLATLVDEGIVLRKLYSEQPERFEYRLTEKGLDLHPVMLELMAWGDRHAAPNGPPMEIVHNDCGHLAQPVTQHCAHCGEVVTARNVTARPGPGANRSEAA